MLYLGRLWWQKGLDIISDAWAAARSDEDWMLVLAGPDYRAYEQTLRARVERLGLKSSVLITGAIDSTLKGSLLSASECFILPSHSEGFSMSLLEAMAAGLPSIYTTNCNFPELASNNGGWEIQCNVESLTEIIRAVTKNTTDYNKSIGKNANNFGKNNYTSDRIAQDLLKLYKSLIN